MPWSQAQQTQDRGQGNGQNERHHQGDHDGIGHRLEHFAFHALEREDGHKDDDDDDDTEDHGAGDFPSGIENEGLFRQALMTGIREMPVDVFHHHDGGVDHHADGDGQATQGH